MQPSSIWFLLSVTALTLAALAATVVTWDWARLRRIRRFVALGTTQLMVVVCVMVGVNMQELFFVTWDDVLGGGGSISSDGPVVAAPNGGANAVQTPGQLSHAVAAAEQTAKRRPGKGVMVATMITGRQTGYALPARLYLPAAYFDPTQRDRVFPVVEFFTGYLGSLDIFQRRLGANYVLDQLISEGKMEPVVVVIPEQNPNRPKDSECVDAVGGDKADTYVSFDVPEVLRQELRVSKDRANWALMGYSTGAFCAANLALRHPEQFAAVISLSGYFKPIIDKATGDLYRGDQAVKDANNPTLLIGKPRPLPVHFYLFTSGGDKEGVPAMKDFSPRIKSPDTATVVLEGNGGHNFGVWQRALPGAFEWVGRTIGPVTDPAAAPAATATPPGPGYPPDPSTSPGAPAVPSGPAVTPTPPVPPVPGQVVPDGRDRSTTRP